MAKPAVVRIDLARISEAYERWCRVYGRNECQSFWKFISGYTNPAPRDNNNYYLSNAEIKKLEMLEGPNGPTLIKMYKIQKQDR